MLSASLLRNWVLLKAAAWMHNRWLTSEGKDWVKYNYITPNNDKFLTSHHPDPNLTYAEHLVHQMYSKTENFAFGAAWDGDGVSRLSWLTTGTDLTAPFRIATCFWVKISSSHLLTALQSLLLTPRKCSSLVVGFNTLSNVTTKGNSFLQRWSRGSLTFDAYFTSLGSRCTSAQLAFLRGAHWLEVFWQFDG